MFEATAPRKVLLQIQFMRCESQDMIDDDPEIEHSPLDSKVTRDGLTVEVSIYRLKHGEDGWTLEVVDHTGASTVWDQPFATDRDAYAEFQRVLDTEGIRSFSETPPGSSLH